MWYIIVKIIIILVDRFGSGGPLPKSNLGISYISEDVLARFTHEFAPQGNEE